MSKVGRQERVQNSSRSRRENFQAQGARPRVPSRNGVATHDCDRHAGSCGKEIELEALDAVPSQPFKDLFKRKVMLLQSAVADSSTLVNEIIPKLLKEVKNINPLFDLTMMNAGSYYEKLKVCRPNEFDVMVVFKAEKLSNDFKINCPTKRKMDGKLVGFAQLQYQDWKDEDRKWRNFLTRDGKFLSPVKLREQFLKLLRQSIKKTGESLQKEIPKFNRLKVKGNGPAAMVTINDKVDVDVVLSLEVIGWPSCASGWGQNATHKTWPTRGEVDTAKAINKRYYVVAKEPACELTIDPQCRSYWRISFSEVEKALLQPASKNAEKTCYRVVKYIFEAHRRKLQPLTSYHLKSLFLRRRHDDAKRRGCSEETMGRDVARFLKELIDEVASGFLGHFFIAGQNLLSSMEECERERITENLNQILRKLVEDPHAFLDKLNVS